MALFTRLRSLYRHKANEFVAEGPDGKPTPEFLLWCTKLQHLTAAQFRQGLDMLERQEAIARRSGDETWPPSYAGFIGLATMRTKPRSTVEPMPDKVASREEARKALTGILADL